PHAAPLFALLSLYNLFTVAFVLAVLSTAKSMGAASVALAMFSTFISMLGGLFWPIEFVPEFMRRLAWFSPGYWLAQGLANIREITFAGYGMPMLFLAGFTLVALLLGGWKKIQPMEE
ncbi:MAG: ABC transporter permease, partial [Oscillospiraceae bacterium]|nr:ABC transporter permease [Oscillospiraceae bacterium]